MISKEGAKVNLVTNRVDYLADKLLADEILSNSTVVPDLGVSFSNRDRLGVFLRELNTKHS